MTVLDTVLFHSPAILKMSRDFHLHFEDLALESDFMFRLCQVSHAGSSIDLLHEEILLESLQSCSVRLINESNQQTRKKGS
jgi:hypothetical protein